MSAKKKKAAPKKAKRQEWVKVFSANIYTSEHNAQLIHVIATANKARRVVRSTVNGYWLTVEMRVPVPKALASK